MSGGIRPAEGVLDEHIRSHGETRENLWRLARVRVTQGLLERPGRAALERFAEGRALGMRCLDLSPGFRQRRVQRGLEEALRFIDDAQVPCAAWASLGWARWVHIMGGDAASTDLDDLESLARHVALVGDAETRSVGLWSQALTHLARPPWAKRDDAMARSMMERAVRVAPQERWRALDLLTLVVLPAQDLDQVGELARALEESDPRYPEDEIATEQFWELLAEE